MGRFDAILFDVDGTLVDSNAVHAQAWSRAAQSFGFARSVSFFEPLIGMGGDRVLPAIDATLSPEREPGKAMSQERQRLVLEELIAEVRPFAKSRELVQACKAYGLQCIVATSSTPAELERFLALADLGSLMDAHVTGDEAAHAKPASDVITLALQKAGVAPNRALMVGDTPYDIEAARKAGVATIAVRSGGSNNERLQGAIAIFADPADLLAHLTDVLA